MFKSRFIASQFSYHIWLKQLDKERHGGLIVSMTAHAQLKKNIVEIGRRLHANGLIAGADGNISCRLPDGMILITPAGMAKGRMSPDDLVVIDPDGKVIAGSNRPSSEFLMHTAFYALRDDIGAIVHAHPVYCTAFAVAGRDLSAPVLPEVVMSMGQIPLAKYGTPSTPELAASIEEFAKEHNTILLEHHGLVSAGRDLEEAYNRVELAEHFARILHAAESLGGAEPLNHQQVGSLMALKKRPISDSAGRPTGGQRSVGKE